MTARMGYTTYLGFGVETSLGTAQQTPSTYVEYNSESFQKEFTEQVIEAINGTRLPTKRVTLDESVSGSFEAPMVPLMELTLFKHLSGCNYSTVTGTGIYTHTFIVDTIASNTSLTFQICRDTNATGTTMNYTGCRVSSANFSVSAGGLLSGSYDLMGVDVATATAAGTASYGTENPYTFKDATISIGSGSAAAVSSSCVDNWSISINQALVEDRCLGSAVRQRIEPGMAEITGDFNMRYEDNTIMDVFLNQTKANITATFEGPSISATENHSITFKAYNAYFNGSMPNVGSAGEIIKHTIPYRAIRESAVAGALEIKVVTTAATVT